MASAPNPQTSTRRNFTTFLASKQPPANASESYSQLHSTLTCLLSALAIHPAMEPNLDQTYMTPAAYKNKVYFVWDFVGRTLAMLQAMPDPSKEVGQDGPSVDVVGRCTMLGSLILDKSGRLDMMCPDERGQKVEFGKEIDELAKMMRDED